MAQGKLKVKANPPITIKKNQKKGTAATRRTNAPMKHKSKETHKLKQIITKTVNKSVEAEIRSRAGNKETSRLSKAQQAVAEYNKKIH